MIATIETKKTTERQVDAATEFLEALVRRNFEELATLFASNVWLRALLPRRLHESTNAPDAVEAFRGWFEGARDFRVLSLEHHPFVGGREIFSYRFLLRPDWAPEQWHVIEQVGYFRVKEGRISRIDLVCSGFLPSDELEPS